MIVTLQSSMSNTKNTPGSGRRDKKQKANSRSGSSRNPTGMPTLVRTAVSAGLDIYRSLPRWGKSSLIKSLQHETPELFGLGDSVHEGTVASTVVPNAHARSQAKTTKQVSVVSPKTKKPPIYEQDILRDTHAAKHLRAENARTQSCKQERGPGYCRSEIQLLNAMKAAKHRAESLGIPRNAIKKALTSVQTLEEISLLWPSFKRQRRDAEEALPTRWVDMTRPWTKYVDDVCLSCIPIMCFQPCEVLTKVPLTDLKLHVADQGGHDMSGWTSQPLKLRKLIADLGSGVERDYSDIGKYLHNFEGYLVLKWLPLGACQFDWSDTTSPEKGIPSSGPGLPSPFRSNQKRKDTLLVSQLKRKRSNSKDLPPLDSSNDREDTSELFQTPEPQGYGQLSIIHDAKEGSDHRFDLDEISDGDRLLKKSKQADPDTRAAVPTSSKASGKRPLKKLVTGNRIRDSILT